MTVIPASAYRAPGYYRALGAALMKCEAAHEAMVTKLVRLRDMRGRLFVLGVGGGAANAAHAVCDFRKLCGIEAYAPSDGIAELTARVNDEGWATAFTGWLRTSRISDRDAMLIFSVGGGHASVSACIYEAVLLARQVGAEVLAVVGRPDGIAARVASAGVVVDSSEVNLLTPVTEAAQIAVLHALVSDPRLQLSKTKW